MKPKPHSHPFRLAISSSAIVAVFAMSSLAHSQTWDAGASTRNWSTAANWSGDALPAFDNVTDISYTANVTSPFFNTQMEADRTIRSLTIGGSTTTAFGIGGGASTSYNLTFGGAGGAAITIQSGAAGAVTLGNIATGSQVTGIILAENLLITHNGAANLSINRPVSGTGFGITKEGTGTAILGASNTFTGGVTVNGGILQLSGANAIAGAINVTSARLNAAASLSTGDDLDSASAINLNGGTLAISMGTFATNKTHDGAGININTNPSTITWQNTNGGASTLSFSGANAFAVNSDLTIDNLSTATTVNQLINLSRNMTGSGDVIVETNNNISSSITSNYTLGRVAFNADNSAWTGDLIVAEGTASLATASAANSSGNSTTGQLVIGETSNAHGAGIILGAANASHTIARNIAVRQGGFRSIKGAGDGFYILDGDIALEGTLNMDLNFNAADRRIQVFGDISGVGGLDLTESGVGQLFRLKGNNTYQGATTINASVDLRATNGNGIGDTSALTFAGAGANLTLETESLPVVETVGSIASADGVGTINLDTNTLAVGGLNTSTSFGGSITGTGGLTKVGSGILTLTGNSTYTGALTLSGAGGLRIISDGSGRTYSPSITGSGGITVETSNDIAAPGDDFLGASVQFSGNNSTWNGGLTVAKGTVRFVGNGVNSAGAGTITLGTTADAFGAGLTFAPGSGNGSTTSYPSPITVTSGGFRAIKGSITTNDRVTLSGPILLNTNLTLDHSWASPDNRITLNGIVSGSGGLTITRSDGSLETTVVLTKANTYGGPTVVKPTASLAIITNASVTSNITVESTGRVGGDGGTSGNLTLAAGANFYYFYTSSPVFDVGGTVNLDNSFGVANLRGGSRGEAFPWDTIPLGSYILISKPSSDFSNIQNFGITNAGNVAPGRIAYFENNNGLQLVIASAASNPYNTWSGGAPFGSDANNDGVTNGMAFLLGASGPTVNANGLLPAPSQSGGNLTLTFSMRDSAARGTASLEVQHSSDLGITDPWSAAVVVPDTGGTSGGITFTVSAGTPPLNNITATIPASGNAAGGKLFGRAVAKP